jgi:hypothetical protein
MKKNSFIIFIALATLFVSCNKEDAINEVQSVSDIFTHSKSVTVYTSDSLSNVEFKLSSDDQDFLDETARRIRINATNEDLSEISSLQVPLVGSSINATNEALDESERFISISIVKTNSKFSTIETYLDNGNENALKTAFLPSNNTYQHDVVESVNPYCAIQFYYYHGDSCGIVAIPVHKESWLGEWKTRNDLKLHMWLPEDNGIYYHSPYNDNDPTYKHGFKVTTNGGYESNYKFKYANFPIL